MVVSIKTCDATDLVRSTLGDKGPSDAYDINDVEVAREEDRLQVSFSVHSVPAEPGDCFPEGETLAQYELNPDGDDAYRSLLVIRFDDLVENHVVILDVLHTTGAYNDNDYNGYVSGTLIVVEPGRADAEVANYGSRAETRAAAAVADTIRQCVVRLQDLDTSAWQEPRLQDALSRLMRHIASRV